ncbi:hypothetical protein Tco_1526479, partial [Tanacetum coccineum]
LELRLQELERQHLLKDYQILAETQDPIHASLVVHTVLKEEGLEQVLNWLLQESFHEAWVLNCFVQKP